MSRGVGLLSPEGSDPYVPGHGDSSYSVRHYDLDLAYKPSGNRLSGEATLTCVALEDLDRLALDLHHLTVAKVWVDETSARFSHRRGRLTVRLPAPVAEDEELTVRVKYAGSPRPVRKRHLGDAGWEELTDGVIVAAQPHGAPSWFPCNDRPDDKATYSVRVEVPADYHVALNGGRDRTPRRHGATRTWTGRMDVPMATYLATVQIGRYDARTLPSAGSSTRVRLVAPADVDGPAVEGTFGRQPEMVAAFEERFGAYPFPDAGYTSVITGDDLEIPLESQSLSTFGRNFTIAPASGPGVDRDDWDHERLVAHELAHQWFGNAVTLTAWRDIWLHEGFACYAEWLWSEASGRRTASAWADHHHARLTAEPQDLLLADPGPDLMFDDRVYKRGALTLAALRARIGDDLFFDVLRRWVADHLGGSVSTELFEAHCAAVIGEPLTDLFDAWLRDPSLPPASW